MKKENFSYSFTSSKMPEEVFDLLLNVQQWWSGFYEETIDGKSHEVNDVFTFNAGQGMHFSKQRLEELVPGKKIVWQVTDSNLTFLSDPAEWTGSRIRFDITAANNKTQVLFTHEGLVPDIECYNNCSSAWTQYLGQLKKNLE